MTTELRVLTEDEVNDVTGGLMGADDIVIAVAASFVGCALWAAYQNDPGMGGWMLQHKG